MAADHRPKPIRRPTGALRGTAAQMVPRQLGRTDDPDHVAQNRTPRRRRLPHHSAVPGTRTPIDGMLRTGPTRRRICDHPVPRNVMATGRAMQKHRPQYRAENVAQALPQHAGQQGKRADQRLRAGNRVPLAGAIHCGPRQTLRHRHQQKRRLPPGDNPTNQWPRIRPSKSPKYGPDTKCTKTHRIDNDTANP